MRHVLDASALLAILLDETGADAVSGVLPSACIGTVNLAEVATVLARRGLAPDQVRRAIDLVKVIVVPLDRGVATDAGTLWPITRAAGASLGDRCALALARLLDATLVTSDSLLAKVAPDASVTPLLFRQRPGAG